MLRKRFTIQSKDKELVFSTNNTRNPKTIDTSTTTHTDDKFFISYLADTTLPDNSCHKGLERFSTRKRSKFFPKTDAGIKAGMEFFKECKYPITQKKSLLFLKPKRDGIQEMNKLKRMDHIKEFLTKEDKDSKSVNFEEFKNQLKNL